MKAIEQYFHILLLCYSGVVITLCDYVIHFSLFSSCQVSGRFVPHPFYAAV